MYLKWIAACEAIIFTSTFGHRTREIENTKDHLLSLWYVVLLLLAMCLERYQPHVPCSEQGKELFGVK